MRLVDFDKKKNNLPHSLLTLIETKQCQHLVWPDKKTQKHVDERKGVKAESGMNLVDFQY